MTNPIEENRLLDQSDKPVISLKNLPLGIKKDLYNLKGTPQSPYRIVSANIRLDAASYENEGESKKPRKLRINVNFPIDTIKGPVYKFTSLRFTVNLNPIDKDYRPVFVDGEIELGSYGNRVIVGKEERLPGKTIFTIEKFGKGKRYYYENESVTEPKYRESQDSSDEGVTEKIREERKLIFECVQVINLIYAGLVVPVLTQSQQNPQ